MVDMLEGDPAGLRTCYKLTLRVNPPEACGRLTARKCAGEGNLVQDKLIHRRGELTGVFNEDGRWKMDDG